MSIAIHTFASAEDARSALSLVLGSGIRNPWVATEFHCANIVEDQQVPGLPETLAYEERSEGRHGLQATRLLANTVETVMFVLRGNSLGDPWSWEELVYLALVQAERIRNQASSG